MDEGQSTGPATATPGEAVAHRRVVGATLGRQMFDRNPAVVMLIDPSVGSVVDANLAAARW
jgi:hypothetical protein